MKKKDLQYLLAYAKERGLMHLTFEEVLVSAGNNLEEGTQYWDCTPDEYIEFYLSSTKVRKEETPEISEEELQEFMKDIPENEEKMISLAIHHSHLCEEYDLDPEDLSFERNIELYLLHKKTGLWIL